MLTYIVDSQNSLKYTWTSTERFLKSFENATPEKREATLSYLQDLLEVRQQQKQPTPLEK